MSKVLQERGFGSLSSSTETNPRDQVKSISTAKADFSGIRRFTIIDDDDMTKDVNSIWDYGRDKTWCQRILKRTRHPQSFNTSNTCVIPENNSALAVEINLTWSRDLSCRNGRLTKPSCLQEQIAMPVPICISKVLIEAPWFLISASAEARISLIMFEFFLCLLADSAINLASDSSGLGLRSGLKSFPLFR
ncbi:hypothetical protein Tco_0296123 [Tanacetum coccineum]